MKFLIDKGLDVNAKAKQGETVLMFAAWHGRFEVVKFLIDKGADVNATSKDGQTALSLSLPKTSPRLLGARRLMARSDPGSTR